MGAAVTAGLVTGLIAIAVYLMMLLPAKAGIIEGAAFVVSSFLATVGFTAAAINVITPLVLTTALVAGSYALNALMTPKLGSSSTGGATSVDPGRARDTFENQEGPEIRAGGRVRLGGLVAFGNTAGANRYRMTLHCKGECDGYERVFFKGREIIAEHLVDGEVRSYPWNKDGGPWARFKFKSGNDTEVAWSELISSFPALYTTDHRARGIAQSLSLFVTPGFADDKFLLLYQGGVPNVEVEMRAEKGIYDPRIGSSQWTMNGVLLAMHILRSYPEFENLSNFDLEFIASEADKADVALASFAGTSPRSQCSGVWSSETTRSDNMKAVLDSIGAWIVPRDSGYKIGIQLIDDDPSAAVTIVKENIIDLKWQSGPAGVERPNTVRCKFYSRERNYELAQLNISELPWSSVASEIAAYGEKPLDVDLRFCPDSSQAQRIARRMFAMARADSGTLTTNMSGLAAWGERIINIEFPDDLGTAKAMIFSPRIIDQEGKVEIPFIIWPSLSGWNPAADEAPPPEEIPEIPFGSPLTTPAAPSAATVVQYQAGLGYATRIAIAIPGDATVTEAAYRTYSNGKPSPWAGMDEFIGANGYAIAWLGLNLTGAKAEFRLRTSDADANGSGWSDSLLVDPLAVNNAAPSAPPMSGTMGSPPTLSISTAAPASLNVAYITYTGTSAPTVNSIRPDELVPWSAVISSSTNNNLFTAIAHASNGTASATTSLRASYAVNGGNEISATATQGSGRIDVWWFKDSTPGVVEQRFTGPGAPSPQTAGSGTWTATGLSPGTYTFTSQGYDGFAPGGSPVGSAASLDITV